MGNIKTVTWHWENIPTGSKFRGIWDGKLVEGRIYNDTIKGGRRIFFCQDVKDGASAPDKLGYEFSWAFNINYDLPHVISDLEIELDPEFTYKEPITFKLNDEYNVTINPYNLENIKVGCQTISVENVRKVLETIDKLKG